MHDPSRHDDAGPDRRPPDELTRRLAARGNGNVGVIDVRRAGRQYESALDWAAGRLVVLRLLNARYGTVNTGAAGSRDPLPIVSGRLARKEADMPPDTPEGDTGPAEDSPPNSGGGAPAPETGARGPNVSATPTEGIAPAEASAGAEPSRRKSEHGAALETASRVVKEQLDSQGPTNPAPTMTLTGTATVARNMSAADALSPSAADARRPAAEHEPSTTGAEDGLITSSAEDVPRSPEVVRLAEADTETGERTSLLVRQRRSSETGGGREPLSSGPREVTPPPRQTPDSIQRADARPETPSLLRMATPEPERQRRQTSSATPVSETGLRASSEQQRAQTPPTQSPLPLAQESVTDSRSPTTSGRHAPERVYRQTIRRTPQADGVAAPFSASVETRPGGPDAGSLDRQDAGSFDGRAATARAAAAEQKRTHLSAPEVLHSTLRLAPARMVWRKSLGTVPADGRHTTYSSDTAHSAQPGVPHSPLPLVVGGNSTTLYRQEATAAFTPQEAGAAAPVVPVAAAPTGAAAIDLEQITEHVSRVILRRLAVERERRGGGRWL